MSSIIFPDENLDELEDTIADVVRTLRRNASKTLEMKRRTAKVLQDASIHRSGSFQRSYILNNNQARAFTTSLSSLSRYPNHSQPVRSIQANAAMEKLPSQTERFDSTMNDPGKTKVSPNKVKCIVFKTLDRIFQIRNGTSKPPRPKSNFYCDLPVKIDKPGGLTELGGYRNSNKQSSNTAEKADTCLNQEFFSHPVSKTDKCPEVISMASSTDEENSWIYVKNPILVQDVIMDDSLSNSSTNDKLGNALTNHRYQNETKEAKVIQKKSPTYIKNVPPKGSESKVKRLRNESEKKAKATKSNPIAEDFLVTVDKKTTTRSARPDSPLHIGIASGKRLQRIASLPNLMESSLADSLSDCNTDSFSREIALRPSSTLLKDAICGFVPTPDLTDNETDDDDGLSVCSSSSFLYTMMSKEPLPNPPSHPNCILPVPSALCQDVFVMPISVPILPIKNKDIREISNKEVRKISQTFIAREDERHKQSDFGTKDESSCPAQPIKVENEVKTEGHEMKIVRDAFSWLDDENVFEGDDTKENIAPAEGMSFSDTLHAGISCGNGHSNVSSCSTLNSSVPPPPPLPPPMPPQSSTIIGSTSRCRLPLAVFTQPRSGNTIFNSLKCMEIGEIHAKKLKEKCPLLNKKHDGRQLKMALNSKTSKFQLNMELFLKKWEITGPKTDELLTSIATLNAKPNLVDMACVLTIPVPKKEEMEKIGKAGIHDESNTADIFLSKLTKVPRLIEKLQCIEFSLDFDESTRTVFHRIDLFTSACAVVSTSTKFIKIINVLMTFMNCLNPDEGSTLYGFDIQSLSKLAVKASGDGSTTLLHFLIEYLLNEPSCSDSIDFYLDFKDLPTVSKISLSEIADQRDSWNKSLALHKKELAMISEDSREEDYSFEYATAFHEKALLVLQDLTEKLNTARQVFQSCKECYGLSNPEITETGFFNSLSHFIITYRQIHNEVVEQSKRMKAKRRNSFAPTSNKLPVKKGALPQRSSCDFRQLASSSIFNYVPKNDGRETDDLEERLFAMLQSNHSNQSRVPKRTKKP